MTELNIIIDLINQFIKGVSFMHEHGVAHLDLKPANIVVEASGGRRRRRPWLAIIDLGVSEFSSLDSFIEGFVGTPPWTAPEVGTKDGHTQRYNPVRADLWSTGRILQYFMSRHVDLDYCGVPLLARALMNSDPLQRPTTLSPTFQCPQSITDTNTDSNTFHCCVKKRN